MEDDVLAEARSFFNLVREASNQGDVDLILAKILAAGSKHISLVDAHLAKNGLRPPPVSDPFRFTNVMREHSRIARAADTRVSRAKTARGSVASNVSVRTGSRGTCTRARARTRTGKKTVLK